MNTQTPDYVKRHAFNRIISLKKKEKPTIGEASSAWSEKGIAWRKTILRLCGYPEIQANVFVQKDWHELSLHVRAAVKKYARKLPEQFEKIVVKA